MPSAKQRRWDREELLRTLALYYRIPFGKMHARNPDVISLSLTLDRTPSAVAMKLVNFASLDPELQSRGVSGMQNTSALDREVWAEYFNKWELLSEMDQSKNNEPVLHPEHEKQPGGPTERVVEAKVRRGQQYFRAVVVAAYEGVCCLTGIGTLDLLRASHIVPWAVNADLRLEPRNGLCLNALHDAAFDRGLITLSESLEVVLSKKLVDTMPADRFGELFGAYEGNTIRKPERLNPDPRALAYHRRHVFVS